MSVHGEVYAYGMLQVIMLIMKKTSEMPSSQKSDVRGVVRSTNLNLVDVERSKIRMDGGCSIGCHHTTGT